MLHELRRSGEAPGGILQPAIHPSTKTPCTLRLRQHARDRYTKTRTHCNNTSRKAAITNTRVGRQQHTNNRLWTYSGINKNEVFHSTRAAQFQRVRVEIFSPSSYKKIVCKPHLLNVQDFITRSAQSTTMTVPPGVSTTIVAADFQPCETRPGPAAPPSSTSLRFDVVEGGGVGCNANGRRVRHFAITNTPN